MCGVRTLRSSSSGPACRVTAAMSVDREVRWMRDGSRVLGLASLRNRPVFLPITSLVPDSMGYLAAASTLPMS